jgi:hypothetical protein
MPRLITSSAISRWVQWVIGRPDWLGASHAMPTIAQICWGVNRAGLPERGASAKRSSMLNSASGIGWNNVQRSRQWMTVSRVTCRTRAISVLLMPSAASRMIPALRAICWAVE